MKEPTISKEVEDVASHCRHYAMCKIDYLGTGLCPSGPERRFVAYYPQGRMDICDALAKGLVPVTAGLLDAADTCTLCGICDKQCHFYTGLRPMTVMRALKDYVAAWRAEGGKPEAIPEDGVLRDLRKIVGREWASNDPAILVTYSNDPWPLTERLMPGYVALPGSREEIRSIVALANERSVPIVTRGNGGSALGIVFTEGIVIDTNRMRSMKIDRDNWTAEVEPGVTSFDFQREAYRHGLRGIAAEPAATVCGNILCTGTFSSWMNVYGTAADNFIDMEFVGRDGKVFHLNDKAAPNHFSFDRSAQPLPGICTRAAVRLHPVMNDEEGILVPFEDFTEAARFARELSQRRIGLALAVLGAHYIGNFMSPSKDLADRLKRSLPEVLGCNYMVMVVGDRFARQAIRSMAGTVIDASLFRTLMLGLPNLLDPKWAELLRENEGAMSPCELLCSAGMGPVLEAILDPSGATIAGAVEKDLRDFYTKLYERREMTDIRWLNMFRIVSSRMSRVKHAIPLIAYVPLDRVDVIVSINDRFKSIGDANGLDNDYGFIAPLDLGKRAILEYDYYIDQTSRTEIDRCRRALTEVMAFMDDLTAKDKTVEWLLNLLSQGCSRKENFLYRSPLRPEGA